MWFWSVSGLVPGLKRGALTFYLLRGAVCPCVGFVWQDFGSWGSAGLASLRSCQKLSLCLVQPMPTGPKTVPLLAKAEPTRDSGSFSGIT